VNAGAIHQQNGLNLSVCVRKTGSAVVGQLGKLRPIVNRPTAAQDAILPHLASDSTFMSCALEENPSDAEPRFR
jgi:hypothetical protein